MTPESARSKTTALAGAMYAVYLGFVSPEITSPARAAASRAAPLLTQFARFTPES